MADEEKRFALEMTEHEYMALQLALSLTMATISRKESMIVLVTMLLLKEKTYEGMVSLATKCQKLNDAAYNRTDDQKELSKALIEVIEKMTSV